jgi:hypothetical protein
MRAKQLQQPSGRFEGETTTTIATLGDPTDVGFTNLAAPSINECGQVAFLVDGHRVFCVPTSGSKVVICTLVMERVL